jgi:hypothetical protein
MISDESQKPGASFEGDLATWEKPTPSVVDQMAADRHAYVSAARSATVNAERLRDAAPQMLAALREAEAALSMTAKEPTGDFVSTDMLALRTVRAAIAAAEGRAA